MSYTGTWYFGHMVCEMPGRSRCERLFLDHDALRFHTVLVENAKKAARTFRGAFSEYFRLAAYPALLAHLDHGEISLCAELSRNGRREHDMVWQVINHRMFRQVRAIASGASGMEGMEAWVSLFNRFMERGAARVAKNPPSLRIYCARAEKFVPYFCDHVAPRLCRDMPCSPLFDDLREAMEGLCRASEMHRILDQASLDVLLQWAGRYGEAMLATNPDFP